MPSPPVAAGEIDVVPATGEDREWAARVMASSDPWLTLGRGLEHCRARCTDPAFTVLVARHRGERCGFAILNPRGVAGSPYLASFAVEEAWRSRGVGARLLEACERHFAPASPHFFLCVSSFNVRARAFYERHGYRQVGEFEDYVVEGASEILMYKRLEQA
ncbi:MAG: GCN5-related N-acetyltransferase [Acidobacteria bacterium]|nr:GCN5-related N-acetyltransferase [Acidobacteriota bacterium]